MATNDVFENGQLFGSDRAARMDAAGCDPDLGPHAKFTAIGKLGRCVVNDDASIDLVEETFSC